MQKQTIAKLATFISLAITFFSAIVALLSGGDLFFVIVVRFLMVFVISMAVSWIALSIINSVIINAAEEAIEELRKELEDESHHSTPKIKDLDEMGKDDDTKGQNFDFLSEPTEDEDFLNVTSPESPEINEFEPFKPRRIDADKADNM
jgi:hypothetical protein